MIPSAEGSNLFSITDYKTFAQLPLDILNEANFSVYIINYDWVYLFINKSAIRAYGRHGEKLLGRNALEAFKNTRLEKSVLAIKDDVDRRLALHTIVESPLRGNTVILKGYPLDDCYYFTSIVVPARVEVLNDLRNELNKRKLRP